VGKVHHLQSVNVARVVPEQRTRRVEDKELFVLEYAVQAGEVLLSNT
jgi:hypothetical protein